MKKQGTFLKIPYDWNWPTRKKIKDRIWNKNDHKLFPPKAFGWGWTINLYELLYERTIIFSVFAGILLGIVGGPAFILIPWAIVGIVVGYFSKTQKDALLNDFFLDF